MAIQAKPAFISEFSRKEKLKKVSSFMVLFFKYAPTGSGEWKI